MRLSTIFGLSSIVALISATPVEALALNGNPHRWTVHAATTVLYDVGHGQKYGPYDPPLGVSQAEYALYLAEVAQAYHKLIELRSGLMWHVSARTSSDGELACGYDQGLNLKKPDLIPIKEFPFALESRDYNLGCAMTPLPCEQSYRALGHVLGWHAWQVDEHVDDLSLWFRPTNAGVIGLVKEGANRLWEYGVGILLAPIFCLFGDCGGGFEVAHDYNPIEELEGLVPGIGNWKSTQFTGLWHFIDQEVNGSRERFNDPPGMYYEAGGPNGVPGALDVGIMVLADTTGLSIRVDESDGVGRYGHYDDDRRSDARWQAHSIAHTEFSPIDNLAQWGWKRFQDEPTNARWLGHPLHALGDVAMPQHLTSTTSWGHRPFEDAQNDDASWVEATEYWNEGAGEEIDTFSDTSGIPRSILHAGYWLWREFSGPDGALDIEGLITFLAERNYPTFPNASYQDLWSAEYQAGMKVSATDRYLERDYSGSNFADINRLAYVSSLGGMVTLLTAAAKHVAPTESGESFTCPSGTHYSGRVVEHAEDTSAPTWTIPFVGGDSGSDAYDTQDYWEIEGCVPGVPTIRKTICPELQEPGEGCEQNADCTTGRCLSGTCVIPPTGPSEPYDPKTICDTDSDCKSGVCDPTTHQCAGAADTPCTKNRDCIYLSCVEHFCLGPLPTGSPCTEDQQCESEHCALTCKGELGDSCTEDAHCLSGTCLDGLCSEAKLPDFFPCTSNEQCVSGMCISGFCGTVPK